MAELKGIAKHVKSNMFPSSVRKEFPKIDEEFSDQDITYSEVRHSTDGVGMWRDPYALRLREISYRKKCVFLVGLI